ncbi:MAG: class B sortase, partial [Firmicutes bacterium]|nr:class B sortase [Bacillota bacterium]
DFIRSAQAVALRPAGETYPPTASPVPRQTPSPTPRIAQNDPLIGALGDVDPNQSVAPGGETPAPRYKRDRYPYNPLLVIRDEVSALQLINPDIVGRLVIDGVMDENVVMRNNTYYLNHNAAGDYSGYGAVFADQNLAFRYPPENIVLYGRTSSPGKTFAPLKNYADQGIGFAQEHPYITFAGPYEEARYGIIAVIRSSGDPAAPDFFDAQVLAFATDEDMLAFASEAVSRSLYSFNASVQASDRLLTLVTLSDGTDVSRIIVVCRMLREGEAGYIAGETPAEIPAETPVP